MRFIIFLIGLLFSFQQGVTQVDLLVKNVHNVIPAPRIISIENSISKIDKPRLYLDVAYINNYTKALISDLKGTVVSAPNESNIEVRQSSLQGPGSYKILFNPDYALIEHNDLPGLQYALLSLADVPHNDVFFPCLHIEDNPRFSYRGMHLDVSRHFFTKDEVKKYIDFLAKYKFNRFHWHLTDDQGWRIEIKKYPRLQKISAFRNETLIGHFNDQPQRYDGKQYGGYYTQDEIREVVAYATDRSITIIPEIEMPGHAQAALAAYPEYGCEGTNVNVATKWGIFEDVFCPKPETFEFLHDILDEVVALFPSKEIHIGGDECPKEAWKRSEFCQALIKREGLKDEHELQAFFIKEIQTYLRSKHQRNIIGWDEILEGNLTSQTYVPEGPVQPLMTEQTDLPDLSQNQNPIIMSWRGNKGGIEAANAGYFAIMTPGSHCYFDHYQSQNPGDPVAIGGYTPIKKVFDWTVIPPNISSDLEKYILGGQANLWTEYISTFSQLEYMAYARGIAMSEALWRSENTVPYHDFVRRFEQHAERLRTQKINVANHVYELKPTFDQNAKKELEIKFELPNIKTIRTSIEGGKRDTFSSDQSFELSGSGTYEFELVDVKSPTYVVRFDKHIGVGSQIKIEPEPSKKYPGNGPISIVNGITGSDTTFGGTEWLGFEDDANVTLTFEENKAVNQISLRFFKGEGQWIYLPSSVDIYLADEERNDKFTLYKTIKDFEVLGKIGKLDINISSFKTKAIRVVAHNFGQIPEGSQGSGHKAWLFVDEVIVK